ncbi:HEXXH motif domain-containing protein [Actinoplanes utahensis]|uniref:HEXXH motif domain-containing protein n=1 Tax=Actinoplanes utahensis TaxID=1869 RepID=A0A0A6UXL0_ACTUT|nr:HEXXH motif domain-containing protein [Actinoplanes utahensis]KHD79169.1 hypothetical protein MB27_00610 [Actinoplanes utahensis]GIF34222.1 HEXXH motif domain-containing protein [Actinoplanes utahensis]
MTITSSTDPVPIQLSAEDFDRLAAGDTGPGVIRQLIAIEHSRRLALLLATLKAAAENPFSAGPLPSAERTWDSLEEIQAQAPDAVAAVLLHPPVGRWLAHLMRRHHGGTGGRTPAHIDFGQLNTLALAASAIAGLPHRTRVPLRAGRVSIPRFGMAEFADCPPWDLADAWTTGGVIHLRHGAVTVEASGTTDTPGWAGLRSVTATADGLTLTVFVDDLDPWRDVADPIDPVRLSPAEFATWERLLQEAWTLLVTHHRPAAEGLAAGFTSLVPLPAEHDGDTRSASSGEAFGTILCSLPPDAVTLAVALAHEFRHIKLDGLMHLVELSEGAGIPCLYAPWRDDPRPAGGLLQGIYAFHGIAGFWRSQRRVPGHPRPSLPDFEYAYSRAQTRHAIRIVLADGVLTPWGRRFVERLAASMDDWSDDDLDPEAAELAALVTDSHRAGWLIRHRHPHPDRVAALAEAWREGTEPGPGAPGADVRPDPAMRRWSGARLGLARCRLVAPDQYAEAHRTGWGARLSTADLRLFAGDATSAVRLFTADLAADPESADAWTGLGLALRRSGDTAAGTVLLQHPDLVSALHRELAGAAEPAELAGWLARILPGGPA